MTASVGSLFFVRWQRPEVEDLQRIVKELAERRQEVGRPVTYVALAPESSDPPEAAARRHMPALMNQALVHCDVMHLVFEGVGFKHSVMRSVMAAVFLAGGRRDRVRIHAHVEDIVRDKESRELSQGLRILALRGLLNDLPAPAQWGT